MKLSNIVLWILFALSAVALGVFAFSETESVQQTTGQFIDVSKGLDTYLYWVEAIIVLAIVVLLGLSALNIKNDPKGALGAIAGVVVFVVLLAVCYFISPASEDFVRVVNGETEVVTVEWLKVIDMWIYSVTALIVAVVALVVVFPILRAVNVIK